MSKNRYIDTHFWKDGYIQELDPIEKLLFLYFISNPMTSICGIYEITIREIAHDTGIDKDMVMKILARFERDNKMKYDMGWLAIKNFIKHQKKNPNIEKGIESALLVAPAGLMEWQEKAFQSLSKPSNYLNINTNINKNTNKKAKGDIIDIPPELLNDDFLKAWDVWIKYRKEIKKKMPPSTIASQLKMLSGYEVHTAIAMIQQSIEKGWTGLFKLKKDSLYSSNEQAIAEFIEQEEIVE